MLVLVFFLPESSYSSLNLAFRLVRSLCSSLLGGRVLFLVHLLGLWVFLPLRTTKFVLFYSRTPRKEILGYESLSALWSVV